MSNWYASNWYGGSGGLGGTIAVYPSEVLVADNSYDVLISDEEAVEINTAHDVSVSEGHQILVDGSHDVEDC